MVGHLTELGGMILIHKGIATEIMMVQRPCMISINYLVFKTICFDAPVLLINWHLYSSSRWERCPYNSWAGIILKQKAIESEIPKKQLNYMMSINWLVLNLICFVAPELLKHLRVS